MADYSPAALRHLFDLIHGHIPQAVLSGILGDASHTYGYHRGAAYVPSGDYSRQFAEDRNGVDGQAACALDVSLPADLMRIVSHRLMVACQRNDPRLHALREWFGTENGTVVTGWDRRSPATPSDDCLTSSDDSHLWHIHLSVYRSLANNADALAPIAAVMAGIEGDDEMSAADIAAINKHTDAAIHNALVLLIHGDTTHPNSQDVSAPLTRSINTAVNDPKAGLVARVASLQAQVSALHGSATPDAIDYDKLASAVADKLAARLSA